MPDFERVTRSLELHLAQSPAEKAFVRGKHAGLDKARKQVAVMFTSLLLTAILVNALASGLLKGLLG